MKALFTDDPYWWVECRDDVITSLPSSIVSALVIISIKHKAPLLYLASTLPIYFALQPT